MSKECGHMHASCAHADTVCSGTIYSRRSAQRNCMSFLWCTHLKHMDEKWNPIVTEADIYYKTSQAVFQTYRCTHTHRGLFQISTHTHRHVCVFPQCTVYAMSLFCPPPFRYGPSGKDLHAPKYCFSPHYCQGIHQWLMMDYISASAQGFPLSLWLTATLNPRCPRCYTYHEERCSGNITRDLFAPFSSCSLGSCFTGDAQGGCEAYALI